MSLFDRFTNRARSGIDGQDGCMHVEFTPMWESVSDMGRRDRISRYKCAKCSLIMPAGEARALLARRSRRPVAA